MAVRSTFAELSLFAGYAGHALALKLLFGRRHRTVGYVERDAFASSLISARFQDGSLDPAPVWDMVESFNGGSYRGRVDLVTASPPCQPFSCAGKQRGNEDGRAFGEGGGPLAHMLRIIAEVEPPVCFFENAPQWVTGGHFEPVGRELHRMGYRIEKPLFFAAEDVGATHRRTRVFILAYTPDDGYDRLRQAWGRRPRPEDECGELGHSDGLRRPEQAGRFEKSGMGDSGAGSKLGDAQHGGLRPGNSSIGRKKGNSVGRADTAVADGDGEGLEERLGFGCHHGEKQQAVERTRLPLFPPAFEGQEEIWMEVLGRCPALKPAFRRVADGSAVWVDRSFDLYWANRIRACGNGLLPVGAAYAFATLAARIVT